MLLFFLSPVRSFHIHLFNECVILLQAEEVQRNSSMSDMLFVLLSHPLSVSIFTLDERCKQLTVKERAEVKESLKPEIRFVFAIVQRFAFTSSPEGGLF